MLKHKISILLFLLAALTAPAADTLRIAPCNAALMTVFGDLITLERNTGILRRYADNKLLMEYRSGSGNSLTLQLPLRPVADAPERVYVLDAALNRIVGWDRFLNLHSVTPLNDDIVSPGDFTINAEHEWLIYDSFRQEIFQVYPGENYLQRWGDRSVSGEIRMHAAGDEVVIFLADRRQLRRCDVSGNTLAEYRIPDSLAVRDCIPLREKRIALLCDSGAYVWNPQNDNIRLLSAEPDIIFIHAGDKRYTLIGSGGVLLRIP